MKAISLFSGVGGFDLGFERAGIKTVLQAERDPHCLKVLERHWPDVRRIDDVRLVATHQPFDMCPPECEEGCEREPECIGVQEIIDEWEGIDVIHGGFPCQDISAARDRWQSTTGLRGERSGLWWEFYRVVSVLHPTWVVIENVERLRTVSDGKDFRAIVASLDEAGYVGIGIVLDAAAFGLPARRPRIFIVARDAGDTGGLSVAQGLEASFLRDDPGCFVLEGAGQPCTTDAGATRPTPGTFRLLTPSECERAMGFPDNWTAGAAIGARRRMCGNAVVPAVAEWIGRRIVSFGGSGDSDHE
jgi:DNA (cytosine-5)-methyltransferase 1